MLKKFQIFFIAFLSGQVCYGQTIQNIGVPYVENFTKAQYLAENQNWSITKDENGVMYFGNSKGLLSFNGQTWQTHQLDHSLIIRSVKSDLKGKIYTGGFGEFGYWEYNKQAILTYRSLTHLVPKKDKLNNEIWKIHVEKDKVYFQSFASIFIYQNNKIEIVEGNESFLFLLKCKDKYFIEGSNKGLYQLKGNKLEFLRNSEEAGVKGVLSILPMQNGNMIVGTAKNGLFLFDGENFTPWATQASEFLKTFQLNNGALVFNNYFAFGTILNGIIILNDDGEIVQHINKSSGLQNSTVLSLFTDNYDNLWAGLDNGIDRIELNAPLYFFFDKGGQLGTVYSSIIYKEKIYLGTNQGLYYSDWNVNNGKRQTLNFKFIPNSQGQVWELALFDGILFCGHNNGTFQVVGNQIIKLSNQSGGWTIKRMNTDPNKLIQGTYNGLVVYDKTPNGFAYKETISGFNEASRYVEQDSKGNIWVSHPYKGVFKVILNDNQLVVKSKKEYGKDCGLPSTYGVNIFNLDQKIVFSSDLGFYTYDEIVDKFIPYQILNEKLGSFKSSNKIIKADSKRYWFIDHGKVALVNFTKPGEITIDSSKFSVLNAKMVQNYENISKINNELFLISIDDGFVLYDSQKSDSKIKELPQILINKIENITAGNTILTEQASLLDGITIPFKSNSISISYSLPFYKQGTIKYQYKLEGYSDRWSGWSILSQKDFTNLPYGSYQFKVRAKLNDGRVSKESVFKFEISPPFYVSKIAWIVYLLLIIVGIYLVRIWYFKKLRKHENNIQIKLKAERDEQFRQESLINEQKLIKFKNEKLQTEIESKSREVANSAMNIVYKNELLQNIKDEIIQFKDHQGKPLSQDQIKKLNRIIDDGMNDERDWNLFETSFNETHENFFKKLKIDHPDLVPNDLKLCAYLRMNMSSKEMASLLNISVRGVEIRRYRLRKKLNLPHDKNLNEFLIEL
jgi:ligand-binding sensor domain-containing protein/DNA-binding CsgD family transcriptional regulator